jgi:alpha-N-arabinofuranosidase
MTNFTTMTSLLSSDPKKGTFKSPLFYTFKLFSNNCLGNSVDTYVACDTFNTEKFSGIPFLDVSTVYSKESNTVFINVVNRHKEKAITADLSSTSADFSGKGIASFVTTDKINDPFSFDQQSQYIPVTKEIETKENKMTCTFPPHSFTQIKIAVKKQ